MQPAPTKDGNALAALLDEATGEVRARDTASGVYGIEEQLNDSLKTIKGTGLGWFGLLDVQELHPYT
jgi:hypothetical protein